MIKCQKCELIKDTLDICVECVNEPATIIEILNSEIKELKREIRKLKGPQPLPDRIAGGGTLKRVLYGMEDAMKDYTERLNEEARNHKKK
jgi:hypothetical protein